MRRRMPSRVYWCIGCLRKVSRALYILWHLNNDVLKLWLKYKASVSVRSWVSWTMSSWYDPEQWWNLWRLSDWLPLMRFWKSVYLSQMRDRVSSLHRPMCRFVSYRFHNELSWRLMHFVIDNRRSPRLLPVYSHSSNGSYSELAWSQSKKITQSPHKLRHFQWTPPSFSFTHSVHFDACLRHFKPNTRYRIDPMPSRPSTTYC
jgi:hypothetical protein